MVTESRSIVGHSEGLGSAINGLFNSLRDFASHPAASTYPNAEQARYHLGRARRALEHADYQHASIEAAKALAADPHSPWPLITHGRAALATGHAAEAVDSLRLAWRKAPTIATSKSCSLMLTISLGTMTKPKCFGSSRRASQRTRPDLPCAYYEAVTNCLEYQ